MIWNIYTIYDNCADNYRQPLFIENDESAKRMFAWIIEQNPFMKANSEQFELKLIGYFEDKKGELSVETQDLPFIGNNKHICKGADLIGKE